MCMHLHAWVYVYVCCVFVVKIMCIFKQMIIIHQN